MKKIIVSILSFAYERVMYVCVFFFLTLFFRGNAKSQNASIDKPAMNKPKTAAILSTLLPGGGQIYNKKYWKAPIVWGALAGMGYLIINNNDKYHAYRSALRDRSDNDPNTVDPFADIYSEDNLSVLSDYYRRNRDLSYLGITAVYLLNIVDAIVDGHLQEFDVNDNLTLKLVPYYSYGMGSESGLRISMFIH